MPPDLADPAARAAYKAELRRLAFGWRLLGFVLVAGGVGGLLFGEPGSTLRRAGWIALAAGWAIFIAVIAYRTRYHKLRMAGD